MSVKTWKEEFYPIEAKDVVNNDPIVHSLQKWRGLTVENLKKHNVEKGIDAICDSQGEELMIDSRSCALCLVHARGMSRDKQCKNCPLYQALGRPCDDTPTSVYTYFTRDSDPVPMIKALEKALRMSKNWKQEETAVDGIS